MYGKGNYGYNNMVLITALEHFCSQVIRFEPGKMKNFFRKMKFFFNSLISGSDG